MKQPRRLLVEAIALRTTELHDPKALATEIAAYLLEQGRTAELESLLRDLIAYRAAQGVVEADLVSAHDLGEQVSADAKQILKDYYPDAHKVTIHTRLDPALVGGVKLVMPNEQLDLTVRAELTYFKSHLLAGKG